jgi:type I restriction enzyme M protein
MKQALTSKQQLATTIKSVRDLLRKDAGLSGDTDERLRGKVRTPEQRELLQRLLRGSEKKSMPYLLGVMNMLLHGIECPNIVERNALSTNIRQIRDADRVDVMATNPSFGGEEERGILNNFPEGMRTAETALLYFQYVMAMLKRPGGRCGIVAQRLSLWHGRGR